MVTVARIPDRTPASTGLTQELPGSPGALTRPVTTDPMTVSQDRGQQ